MYTTHGQRTEKLAILASTLSCAGCASTFVTRSSSALDQRYVFVVMRCVRRDFGHARKCAARSTHASTRQKDARHAQSALDQRCAFVGSFNMTVLSYTLCMRAVCALYTRVQPVVHSLSNLLASPKS